MRGDCSFQHNTCMLTVTHCSQDAHNQAVTIYRPSRDHISIAMWVTPVSIPAGKQRKLTSWLGGPASEGPTQSSLPDTNNSCQDDVLIATSSRSHHVATPASSAPAPAEATSSAAPTAMPRACFSAFTRKGSGSKAGKQGGKAGQTSLRSFLQQAPASQSTAATTPAIQAAPSAFTSTFVQVAPGKPSSSSMAEGSLHSTATCTSQRVTIQPSLEYHPLQAELSQQAQRDPQQAANAGGVVNSTAAQQQDTILLQQPHSAAQLSSVQTGAVDSRLGPVRLPQNNVFESQSSGATDADKAAATAAWSKIHSKMKAPKCKGHGEDCVIREVKKNGPNKGKHALFWHAKPAF